MVSIFSLFMFPFIPLSLSYACVFLCPASASRLLNYCQLFPLSRICLTLFLRSLALQKDLSQCFWNVCGSRVSEPPILSFQFLFLLLNCLYFRLPSDCSSYVLHGFILSLFIFLHFPDVCLAILSLSVLSRLPYYNQYICSTYVYFVSFAEVF